MAGQLKLRRGTTSQLANYIGSEGELTYDTALKSLVLHDGVTLGGVKIPYLSNDLVPSTMLPTATETVAGKAKIATTEISQAGVNDTDIITAKKLRDALNATGDAPVSACRAWVCFNGKQSPPVILSSLNISSVVKNATGDYTLNFATPLENSNYSVSCGGATGGSESKVYPCVKATVAEGVPVLKTPNQLRVACVISTQGVQLYDMSEIYIEVFN